MTTTQVHPQVPRNQNVLKELLSTVEDLVDMTSFCCTEAIIASKVIQAVRSESIFKAVSGNPPEDMDELAQALRSCVPEEDRTMKEEMNHLLRTRQRTVTKLKNKMLRKK